MALSALARPAGCTVRAGRWLHRCIGSCRTTSSTSVACATTSSSGATGGGGAWWTRWWNASSSVVCWGQASRGCAASPARPSTSWRSAARPGISALHVTPNGWPSGRCGWATSSLRRCRTGRWCSPCPNGYGRTFCGAASCWATWRRTSGSPGTAPAAPCRSSGWSTTPRPARSPTHLTRPTARQPGAIPSELPSSSLS